MTSNIKRFLVLIFVMQLCLVSFPVAELSAMPHEKHKKEMPHKQRKKIVEPVIF